VTKEEVQEIIQKYDQICEEAYKKASEETQVFHKHWLDSPWSGFFEGKDPLKVRLLPPYPSFLNSVERGLVLLTD